MRSYFLISTIVIFLLLNIIKALAETYEIPDIVVQKNNIHMKRNDYMTQFYESTNVINEDTLSQQNSLSLSSVLSEQSGVKVNDLYGDGSQLSISMRGFGESAASNSLVLINGVPYTNLDLSIPSLSIIPVENIQKIDILPGSASVLYGDQAVGGVINIITKDDNAKSTNIMPTIGSYNTENLYLSHTNNINDYWSYDINTNIKNTNNYRNHNNLDSDLLEGNLTYHDTVTTTSIQLQSFYQHELYAGALTSNQVSVDTRQAQPGSDSFANNFINFLRFYYLRKLSNNSRFEMNINSNYENTHGILNNTLDELESSDFSQIHHGNAVYPKFNGDFNLFYRNITYIVGGDFSNENYTFSSISNSLSSATNDIRYVGSGYGFLTIPIMEKLNLKLGIRGAGFMDNFSNTKNNSDTVSVSEEDMTYHLTTATSTYIRRAENYRFPKIDEEINYTATGQQVLNPLKTQTGVSYETGVKYVSSRTLLNLTLYQLTLNNEIEYIPTVQSSSLYNTQNLPQTVRHGIIGGVDLILTKKVTLSTQFTYTNPKIVNSGDDIPSVPELTARLGIAYHFNDNWSTHLEALYTGSSYAAGDISNISAKQPGYSIINLNIQWQIKKLILSAKINNLFNKKYNAYALFNPTTGASYYPASGINMYLTANYLVN